MTALYTLIAINVAAFLLIVGACLRAALDERNDHLRFQQPRRLRVGQSNHEDASA